MQIVPWDVTFLWMTPDPLEIIENAGRTAYKTEAKGDPETFVRKIMKLGHESVLEHVTASFRVICDRGVTHEFVRHRLASYTQESTRYCNYGRAGEIAVIEPSDLTAETRRIWYEGCLAAEAAYMKMIAAGAKPQTARAVLPTCVKTEIVVTTNIREYRHFLRLRTDVKAHPDMRKVAIAIRDELRKHAPVLVEDI